MINSKKILFAALALISTSSVVMADSNPVKQENPFFNKDVQKKPSNVISNEAKSLWIDDNFPINEKDVDKYIKKSANLEKSFKPNIDVNLIKKSINIDPNEAQEYPVVIASLGFNTAITFWDSAGEPWDIEYVANGNETQFTIVQPSGIRHKNIIIINPRELLSRTNLTVSLKGEKNPITIQVMTSDLSPNPNTAYGEVAVNMSKRNPAVPTPSIQVDTSVSKSKEDSNILIAFIDGLPPKGAVPLNIKNQGSELKGWMYKDEFYIKTTNALVWPPSKSIQRDGGNSTVYKTAKTPLIRLTNLETGSTKNYEVQMDGQ